MPEQLPTRHQLDQIIRLIANNTSIRYTSDYISMRRKDGRGSYGRAYLTLKKAEASGKEINFWLSNLDLRTTYSSLTDISSSQIVGISAEEIGCVDEKGVMNCRHSETMGP